MWKYVIYLAFLVSVRGLAQPLPANALNAGTGQNVTDHQLILESKKASGLLEESIEGTPYLDEKFELATIRTGRGTFDKVPARYNAYSDDIEYQQGGITFAAAPSLNIRLVSFSSYQMVVDKLPSKGKGLTFFIRMDSGRAVLLMKRSAVLKGAEAPKALEATGKPARYELAKEELYIKIGDQLPTPFSGVKRLIDLLPDHRREVEEFVSANKISKKPEDIVRVVNFYNSLFL